jgi:ABC-2 type transport system permease protein
MRRLAARHLTVILTCAIILAGFQLLMCAIVATMDINAALEQMLAFAPPILQGAIAQGVLAGGSDAGLVAFGWNHPITHALAMAVPITLASRAIAGEVETGAIELVLAQPLSRAAYLSTHVLFAMLAITMVAGAGVSATTIGQRVFQLDLFPPARLASLLFAFFLLQAAVFALTLAFSAWGREAGSAAFAGVTVALLSYLAQAVSALWPRAAWLGRYSLHHYYDPRGILVRGELTTLGIVVLAGTIVIAASVAFAHFRQRDLP